MYDDKINAETHRLAVGGATAMHRAGTEMFGSFESRGVLGMRHELVNAALEDLPTTSWWKLFVGRSKAAFDPDLLFDRDVAKGFREVMTRVFGSELGLPPIVGLELDFDLYESLYRSMSLETKGRVGRGRSGTDSPAGTTSFCTQLPVEPSTWIELRDEKVGYWNTPWKIKEQSVDDKVSLAYHGFPPTWRFEVRYTMTEVPALANAFFERYYREIRKSEGAPLATARAIVRLVRALHLYHFFCDGNARLTTVVILNKLLLENGFPPSLIRNPALFAGGRTLDELLEDVRAGMDVVLREMEGGPRFTSLL